MKKMLFTGVIAVFTLSALSQPTLGLVAYWPMNGSFIDGGPYSIAGTNVAATGTANYNGQANGAMNFLNPGSSVVQYGYHAINSNVNFSGSQDFSFAFSLYLYNPAPHPGGIYDNCLNNGGPGVWMWTASGFPQMQFNYKNNSVGTPSGALPYATWLRVVCLRASGTLKIYINGALKASATEGTLAPAYPIPGYFGTMQYSGYTPPPYNGLNGKIDEFRIYNRALTAQEIIDLYVLPIKLNNFTAIKTNDDILLQWQTATEQNCKHFNVQRSTDGSSFTTIGQVAATGNTSVPTDYHFTDQTAKNISGFKTVFYRLETVDIDANKTYSPVVSIKLDNAQNGLVILQSPTVNDLRLQVSSAEKKNSTFIITDAQGRQLLTRQILLNNGNNAIAIPLNGLARGLYFVTMITDDQKQTRNFLMQ